MFYEQSEDRKKVYRKGRCKKKLQISTNINIIQNLKELFNFLVKVI